MKFQQERRQALMELLSIPDAFDPLRTHRQTLPGKPDRFRWVPTLSATFVQTHLLESRDQETAA